jgi:hypothetical protein
MNPEIQFKAVVEAPFYETKFECPWPVSEFVSGSRIILSGDMKLDSIGIIVAQLAKYNSIELQKSAIEVLGNILDTGKQFVLPGGVCVIKDEEEIVIPGCCCGLESWRGWFSFLENQESPWMGHDPAPWIEINNNQIRIWANGGISGDQKADFVDVSMEKYKRNFQSMEQDLQNFLFCLESWAMGIGFLDARKLIIKFNMDFDIQSRVR